MRIGDCARTRAQPYAHSPSARNISLIRNDKPQVFQVACGKATVEADMCTIAGAKYGAGAADSSSVVWTVLYSRMTVCGKTARVRVYGKRCEYFSHFVCLMTACMGSCKMDVRESMRPISSEVYSHKPDTLRKSWAVGAERLSSSQQYCRLRGGSTPG